MISYFDHYLVSIIFIATILANVLHQLFFTTENVPLPKKKKKKKMIEGMENEIGNDSYWNRLEVRIKLR